MSNWKFQFLLFGIIWISLALQGCFSDEFPKANARVANHVKFSGRIISLKVSGNHAFGIVGISVLETNREMLVDTIKTSLFPYRLSQGYAEYYGYVPIDAKIGFNVEIDADKGRMKIFDKNKLIGETLVVVTLEKANIEFVNRNSKFNSLER